MREQGAVAQAASRIRRAADAARAMSRRVWNAAIGALRGRPILTRLTAAAALAALLGAAGLMGYVAAERDLPEKLQARIVEPLVGRAAQRLGVDGGVAIAWRRIDANGHILEAARIPVLRDGAPLAFALESVGDYVVFASRHGRLGYLDAAYRFAPLDLQVPMGLDSLGESDLGRDPIFDFNEVRTVDLLAVATGSGSFDLYASHHRYTGDCFELVVSRTPLRVAAEGVSAVTGVWDHLYTARPCLPVKHTGMRFAGHEGGGRLVQLDADTLLLSVGVFQYDNVAAGQLAGQDPSIDLGKIIAISMSTGEARTYASGLRNPQGLVVARDGRVWETEHGPQGGDEVNLIVEGANYGWPIVTYGMDYGSPPRDWPFNETPGRHDGYRPPAFAFTPSIGISNVVEPDPREFPRWEDHLAAASLAAGTLFILRVQDDRIVSAEPISFDGARLRDIVSLSDGRIAMTTDAGELILLRNAERPHETDPQTATGLSALAAAAPDAVLGSAGPEVHGARVFFYHCGSCHSLTGDVGVGPPLDGVMGRRIGSVEGYGYSPALREADGAWNARLLRSFILEPAKRFEGTSMPPSALPDYDMDELTRYLASIAAAEAAPP